MKKGGLTQSEASLEDYANTRAVLTIIDTDIHDWYWVFVGQELVYEGSLELDMEVAGPVLDKVLGDDFVFQREWLLDSELVYEMRFELKKLADLAQKFGYEPEYILIYW